MTHSVFARAVRGFSRRLMTGVSGAAVTAGALAHTASAQSGAAAPTQVPQLTIQGRGDVVVTPDRVRVQVGVETQLKSAIAASAENNRKQSAILAALKGLGIPAASITTLNYSVSPVQRYDDKEKRVVLDGYRVSNIVQVESDNIEQAGPIIDAGLAKGANRVAGLEFLVRDAAKARDSALALAVRSARRQADVAAKAAGGDVMELLEINVMDFEAPPQRPMMAMMSKVAGGSADMGAPVSEGTTTVSVTVSTRWRFQNRR